MMSYGNNWSRNKKPSAEVFNNNTLTSVEEPPKPKPYEEDFPALGTNAPPSIKVWGGPVSFAEKARELSVLEKDKELDKNKESQIFKKVVPRNLPKFHNVRRFVEEDSESESEHEKDIIKPGQTTNDDDEGWIEVKPKRRYKKRKTIEEIANEDLLKGGPSEDEDDNTDTVWGEEEKQPNETCWDERY